MNEDELRIKIYERLGLEVGSLASESGNDWQRAKKEVLDDFKAESLEHNTTSTDNDVESHNIDELIANKDLLALYQMASKRLSESDFQKLLAINDKDILIRIANNPSVTDSVAEKLIGTVYLAHKGLLINPSVGDAIKARLLERLRQMPNMYQEMIDQFDQGVLVQS